MRTGFLLAEDEAVKAAFASITVPSDRGAPVPVEVRFADPDHEIEKTLPCITIEFVGISHATNRQHSDQFLYIVGDADAPGAEYWDTRPDVLHYWPDTTTDTSTMLTDEESKFMRTVELIPVDLIYQVVTYCRSSVQDRVLQATLLTNPRLPFRHGFIEIPADGSTRRFDLMSVTPQDIRDQETGYRKQFRRKVYTVMVNAEIPSFELGEIGQALTVEIELNSSLT